MSRVVLSAAFFFVGEVFVRILVATAGHIDHGKSSLVRAITGTDPDRLPEEKSRGITILPGYAHTKLEGLSLSFVDVPGHERFLNHMIQGANGIPVVILVIAADDGVMPQTVEHLEVARLLGARRGLVVITKIDLVDDGWLELVEEDLDEYLEGTFLESAAKLRFSAVRPDSHEAFKHEFGKALLEVAEGLGAEVQGSKAFLPVDRVIRVPGRGVVVTGTLGSGVLETGNSYRLMPSGERVRLRELQVHGEPVERAMSPTRVAANLAGLEYGDIQIGAALVEDADSQLDERVWLGGFQPVRWLSSSVKFPRKGLLHAGTDFAQAHIQVLDKQAILSPGEVVPVRIRLDRAIPLRGGIPYIFRSSSVEGKAGHTLGGGQMWIGGSVARRVRSARDERSIGKVLSADLCLRAEGLVELHHPPVVSLADMSRLVHVPVDTLREKLEVLDAPEGAVAVRRGLGEALASGILQAIGCHHQERPHDPGLDLAQIRAEMGAIAPSYLTDYSLAILAQEGKLIVDGPYAQIPGHEVKLPEEMEALAEKVRAELEKGGLATAFEKELASGLDENQKRLREILLHLVRTGEVRRIAEEYFVLSSVHREFVQRIRDHLTKHGGLQVDDVRQMTNLSRKYLVPLLEDLDKRHVTRRESSQTRVAW